MSKAYLNTVECAETALNLGITKNGYADKKTILLGFMGGMFVSLGSIGYLLTLYSVGPLNAGLAKFLGGMMFPVGIMFVLLVGGSLFTGDALIGVAWANGHVSGKDFLRKLGMVWIGNYLGAAFMAVTAYFANIFSSPAMQKVVIDIATHKAHMGFVENLFSGFLCNILVALSVWMSFSAKDTIGKLMAMWFPILLFVVSGFQHIVANMFYLSMGKLLAPNAYSLVEIMSSHVPVTLGNALSGGLFIPLVYTALFLKKKKAEAATTASTAVETAK